jgi:hypothetical protein
MEAPASEAFVGRGRELGQLGRALDATRAGSGTAAWSAIELPYQPFAEALRPLGGLPQVDGEAASS